MREEPPTLPEQPLPRNLHADGAYTGKSLKETAGTKNIVIVGSDLAGKSVPNELADFCFDESGRITGCIQGITPWASEVDLENMKVKATCPEMICQSCPCEKTCHATYAPTKKLATIHVSLSSVCRAQQQIWIASEEGIAGGRYESGVECLMSQLPGTTASTN